MTSELDRVISELEWTSLELAKTISHRDPAFTGMIHARHQAAAALGRCDLSGASSGHLARLRAVLLLGQQVERSIRQWRASAVDELGTLGNQAGIARAGRNENPSGTILELKI